MTVADTFTGIHECIRKQANFDERLLFERFGGRFRCLDERERGRRSRKQGLGTDLHHQKIIDGHMILYGNADRVYKLSSALAAHHLPAKDYA